MKKGGVRTTGSTVVTSSAWEPVVTAITGQISVTTVMTAVGVAAAVAIGFVFAWWGVRKATRMIMGSFRKGSINP